MKAELMRLKHDKVEREREMKETKKEMSEMRRVLERNQNVLTSLLSTGKIKMNDDYSEDPYYEQDYDY